VRHTKVAVYVFFGVVTFLVADYHNFIATGCLVMILL